MKENIVQTIMLAGGYMLIIEDLSRKIAADTFVVKFKASMSVPVTRDLFEGNRLNSLDPDDIINKLGNCVTYEYTATRNMIMDHEKDRVFDDMQKAFLANIKPYIEKPVFALKLVLKKYQDVCSR